MGNDMILVLWWWVTLFIVGVAAYPLTHRIFSSWYDRGYFFTKAIGLAIITFTAFILGSSKLLAFSTPNLLLITAVVFGLGIYIKPPKGINFRLIFIEELVFLACLLLWAWIKGHEPSIHGLEKFMDFGFTKSILNSTYFPALDMWYAGNNPINYYYFGHTMMAVLTKLSGLNLSYTFNLMLASLFAFTATMSWSLIYQLTHRLPVSLVTAFIITLGGNLQTIYAFTKGYTGDYPPPFWTIFTGKLSPAYWYANATRFIPFTIHEFPSYSFVVSDVHGHVLSLPLVLLALGLLIEIFWSRKHHLALASFYGFIAGAAFMTNALDGPIYMGIFLIMAMVFIKDLITKIKFTGIALVSFGLTVVPFLSKFSSFVSGVAVNCPPAFLAETKAGPLLFETVEKCQRSPLWMMLLLWGFFIYCGLWLFSKFKVRDHLFIILLFVFSVGLIIFPEFFYFKDIYPQHFRSNTMFKLGYQAFIMLGLVSGFAMYKVREKLFWLGLLPLLFLVSIFPYYSVRSYFGDLKNYQGLDGTTWLATQYPDDYAAINWVDQNTPKNAVVVEADGDSYTDYERFSTFTGRQTIVGWAVHEWLWRGSYDVVAPRREEVRQLYEGVDPVQFKQIVNKYGVDYIVVGSLEREKFKNLSESLISSLSTSVFRSGNTIVYAINRTQI